MPIIDIDLNNQHIQFILFKNFQDMLKDLLSIV